MSRRAGIPLVIGVVATLALLGIAVAAPRVAAGGWLTVFIFVSAVPLGSLAWLLIHTLTGGRWGDALQPSFEAAALTMPVIVLAFIPIMIALPLLYPWIKAPQIVDPDVAALYLNAPLFLARSVIAFVGWSALALLLPRVRGRAALLLTAIGLLFHALMMSLLSIDWVLSIEPAFVSTSFGATLAVTQLLTAWSFVILLTPAFDERTASDLGGLMLTLTLGITYLNFMTVLVIWYGDLPDKVSWFLVRLHQPWLWLSIASFVLGAMIPVAALLLARVRRSHAALRLVAISSLAGIALYNGWLVTPVYGAAALGTALLTMVILVCAVIAVRARRRTTPLEHLGSAP